MIELYKYFHIYDQETLPSSFKRNERPSRKHKYQLVRMSANDGLRGAQNNSFIYRAMKTWNDLPKRVVESRSLKKFKQELENAWKELPLRYSTKSDS